MTVRPLSGRRAAGPQRSWVLPRMDTHARILRSPIPLAALALLALVAALALVACGGDTTTEATPTATPTGTVAGATSTPSGASTTDGTVPSTPGTGTPSAGVSSQDRLAGIAGIIPPNFPQPSEDDWLTFFTALPELGEVGGNYTGWSPETGLADLVRNGEVLKAVPGIGVLYATGFHQDTHPGVALSLDFTDPAQVASYTQDLATFAAEHRPLLFGIGNEVNRIWEADPDAYDAWVANLPGIADAIRLAAPETQVFVTFQYEYLRGGGAMTGVPREPRWDLLQQVTPALDLVAFTTYPFFDYESPADLPDDYYLEGAAQAGIPVAFTEVAWPSAPIPPLEGSALAGLGGTEAEQVAFIERLPSLLADVNPAFVMWAWAYDTSAVGPTFGSLGLAAMDGTHKPSWEAWKSFAAR